MIKKYQLVQDSFLGAFVFQQYGNIILLKKKENVAEICNFFSKLIKVYQKCKIFFVIVQSQNFQSEG